MSYFASPYIHGPDSSPVAPHNDGHRDCGRFGDVFSGGYHWERKRQPTPGAQNYAFETLELYEETPIGAGVSARQHFRPMQPGQFYVAGQALQLQGIGGLAAGQYVQQPLIDPYNQSYG